MVWSCDLRASTSLAAKLEPDAYLHLLNSFFDCAAGSAMAEGGEVLKFIGDAVFAIFPVAEDGADGTASAASGTALASRAALAAAGRFLTRLTAVNLARADLGLETLEAAVALHLGAVNYGNVGAKDRLDFTVIGSAANEVARLVELCKELDEPVLFTRQIAQHSGEKSRSLGRFCLRGAQDSHEIFTITSDNQPSSLNPANRRAE